MNPEAAQKPAQNRHRVMAQRVEIGLERGDAARTVADPHRDSLCFGPTESVFRF
jgi:hypothetical protein